ncbi:hypothetical protein, partial [Klebsiella quasipneumoniae]|uniref:hypothetical protein n=1 Tax=Klebsiella quasipneumoniae TaxID=1463165 RepID=UPI003D9FF42F
NAPYLNSGRSSSKSLPDVSRPVSSAAAMAAIGVIERQLATRPINAELKIRLFSLIISGDK